MYDVSEEYKAAIYKTPIYSKITGTITLKNGNTVSIYDNSSASNIVKNSLSITNQCYSKNKLEFGNAYIGQLTIALYNDIDRNALYGAEIALSYHLKLANGTYEAVPLGIYIISQAVRTKRIVKITAYDKMQLLDMDFQSTETAGKIYAVLQYIANITGIQLAQTEDEIEELTNGRRYITIAEDMEYKTYRDIICDIATVLCCFATMTRDGKLKFVEYGTTTAEEIPAGHRNNTDIAEKVVNYDTLKFTGHKNIYTVVKSGQETGTTIIDIGFVPIIGKNHTRDYVMVTLQNMIDKISELYYTPLACDVVNNPALELGDRLELTNGTATECSAPLMYYKWQYHGFMSVKAVGENSTSGESRTSRIAAGTADAVAGVETTIFTYENARVYNLNAEFQQITRIDFVSIKATKGLFHAQILLNVEEEAVIAFKYIFNGSPDLFFMPAQTLAAGRQMITLFYPLIAIPPNTANSFRVQALIESGTATIEEFSIKAAITAQGVDGSVGDWDGTLEIEETFTKVLLDSSVSIKALSDTAASAFDTPTSGGTADTFRPLTLSSITIQGFDEEISEGAPKFVVERAIVEFAGNEYTTKRDGRTVLQDRYLYESTAEEIDSGSLCSVNIITDDKDTIESLTVEYGEL